jgi:hypothetical protein
MTRAANHSDENGTPRRRIEWGEYCADGAEGYFFFKVKIGQAKEKCPAVRGTGKCEHPALGRTP